MLLSVMREVRNFFEISYETDDFEIYNGTIEVNHEYLAGQYIALTGSIMNDGVYRVESFEDGIISFVINQEEYPQWVQPTGAHDAYNIGDNVTHQGYRFTSLINANIWEPGTDPRWWEKLYDSPTEHMTTNEAFTGTIYGLRVPRDFLELVNEISEFQEKQGQASTKVSESFGIYSYALATDRNGIVAGWQQTFSSRLNHFRKMFLTIDI